MQRTSRYDVMATISMKEMSDGRVVPTNRCFILSLVWSGGTGWLCAAAYKYRRRAAGCSDEPVRKDVV
jgi:hypothetical protein